MLYILLYIVGSWAPLGAASAQATQRRWECPVFDNEFEKLIIADEISPDSCRLWDSLSGEKLDKDIFRQDLGNLIDGYREVAKRFGVLPNQSFSELKEVTK